LRTQQTLHRDSGTGRAEPHGARGGRSALEFPSRHDAGIQPPSDGQPLASGHIGEYGIVFSRAFAALAVLLVAAQPLPAMARVLQCVPYAREVSGIEIQGNARTWWGQAEGRYDRGNEPKVGAVLAFRPTSAMPQGHVAVVGKIVDERHVLLDHANWSGPGQIEHHALAEDVSEAGDWSEVRVWYAPIGKLGTRENPTFGFIYGDAPADSEPLAPDASTVNFAAAFADLVPASETAVVVPTLALASAR
jgi:hypothetical protein